VEKNNRGSFLEIFKRTFALTSLESLFCNDASSIVSKRGREILSELQIQSYMNKEEIIKTQQELIDVLYSQVVDLSMMSKIELGDDVIAEIKRLKGILNEQAR